MLPHETDGKPAAVARTLCKKRAVFPRPASGGEVWRVRNTRAQANPCC